MRLDNITCHLEASSRFDSYNGLLGTLTDSNFVAAVLSCFTVYLRVWEHDQPIRRRIWSAVDQRQCVRDHGRAKAHSNSQHVFNFSLGNIGDTTAVLRRDIVSRVKCRLSNSCANSHSADFHTTIATFKLHITWIYDAWLKVIKDRRKQLNCLPSQIVLCRKRCRS